MKKLSPTIRLKPRRGSFYNTAVFLYILHMAVMANLTAFYPEHLMRFRMPSFLLVTALAVVAVGGHILTRGVPLRPLLYYLIFFVVVLLGVFYSPENVYYIRELLDASFVKYSLLFSTLFLLEDDPNTRVRQLTVVALAALLVYHLGISQDMFLDEKGQIGYMTVGYGMAPWWTILAQGVFYYRNRIIKLFCFAALCCFAADIAVYGNRGALLLIAVAFVAFLVAYLPLKQLVLFSGGILAALIGLIVFLQPLLDLAGTLLGLDLGQSRNFRLLSSGTITYDSGRFPIYRACWEAIVQHPLLGNGVRSDYILFPGGGSHNIIIELCMTLGIIPGILVYFWLLYIGFRIFFQCKCKAWKALFIPFYITSMVQMFFGGGMYSNGNTMTFIIIYLTCLTRYPDLFKKDKAGKSHLRTSRHLSQYHAQKQSVLMPKIYNC